MFEEEKLLLCLLKKRNYFYALGSWQVRNIVTEDEDTKVAATKGQVKQDNKHGIVFLKYNRSEGFQTKGNRLFVPRQQVVSQGKGSKLSE